MDMIPFVWIASTAALLAMSSQGKASCCLLLNVDVSRSEDSPSVHSYSPPDTRTGILLLHWWVGAC